MYNWESIKEVISKIARSQKVDDNIPAPLRASLWRLVSRFHGHTLFLLFGSRFCIFKIKDLFKN